VAECNSLCLFEQKRVAHWLFSFRALITQPKHFEVAGSMTSMLVGVMERYRLAQVLCLVVVYALR
jgi:hypothetical protein